jgi:hypothetical protein
MCVYRLESNYEAGSMCACIRKDVTCACKCENEVCVCVCGRSQVSCVYRLQDKKHAEKAVCVCMCMCVCVRDD